VAEEIKSLDQNSRAQLRKYGVRFGAFNIYFPVLLKPAAAELILTLWSLKNAGANGLSVDTLPDPPRAGLTSFNPDPACPEAFYRAYGYHVCGPRAVRLDMLERLADLIRPLLGWRGTNGAAPPKGATGDGGFTVIPEMMSLLGCSPDELSGVLKALGFRLDRRPIKAEAAAPVVVAEASVAANGEAPAVAETVAADAAAEAPAADAVLAEAPAPAAAEAVTASEDAAAAAPVEPKFEDIWRPRRHPRGERRPERGQRNRHRGGDRTPASAAAPAQPDAVAAAAAATPSEAAPAQQQREPRSDRKDDRRPQGKDRGDRGGRERSRDAAPSQHRRGQQGERHRRDEHRKDDRRKAEVHTAAPPRRGGIDPDSPFAALGALRDELAKRGKETST
jgi:ATP-dependent RNA helicase SUPV3L1/SUV3